MNYTTNGIEGALYVRDNQGKSCGGPYATKAKANRRIRDLKANELKAEVLGNLVVPLSEQAFIDACNAIPVPPVACQVGCYPAVSKHSYRR